MKNYSDGQNGFLIIINIILLGLIIYASTSLTVSFFGSIGEGQVKISNLILGIVNDSCKVFFPICIGVAIFKRKYLHATVLIIITVCAMIVSYMASQGLDLNISNRQILGSSNKQELIDLKQENISYKKNLEDEKALILKSLQAEKDSMPNDYFKKKNLKQGEIDAVIRDYDTKITPYQAKIDEYNSKIENYKIDTKLTTEGYHALANSMGLTVDAITKFKNIFLEVLSIVLSFNLGLLLGKTKLFNGETFINAGLQGNSSNDNNIVLDTDAGDTSKVISINNKNNTDKAIGFKCESLPTTDASNKEFSSEDLKRYVNQIKAKGSDICDGYKKISKSVGIAENTGLKIKGYLENTGFLRVEGNKTVVVKDLNSI